MKCPELHRALHTVFFNVDKFSDLPAIRRIDEDTHALAPTDVAKPIIDILISDKMSTYTRTNVKLLWDNPSLNHHSNLNLESPSELIELTLRHMREWCEYAWHRIANAVDKAEMFDDLYCEFEERFFSDTYGHQWLTLLDGLYINRSDHEIFFEPNFCLRYVEKWEKEEINEHRMTEGEYATKEHFIYAIFYTLECKKGEKIEHPKIAGSAAKILLCIRSLNMGGVHDIDFIHQIITCWGPSPQSSRAGRREIKVGGNTVLHDFHVLALKLLWQEIKDLDSDSLRFIASKLDDSYYRDNPFERLVDNVTVLEHIYGCGGQKLAYTSAWALAGNSNTGERQKIFDDVHRTYQYRNNFVHGNSAEILKIKRRGHQDFNKLLRRAEEIVRKSIQLYILNPDLKSKLDAASLGNDVGLKRL